MGKGDREKLIGGTEQKRNSPREDKVESKEGQRDLQCYKKAFV